MVIDSKDNIAQPGQYLTFLLGEQAYGVPIQAVREINQVSAITAVPKTPAWIEGVMNLRGKIIPVINLRMKFGSHKHAYTKETCVIVIESAHGPVGAIVDAIKEVIEFAKDQIEAPPELGSGKDQNQLIGMGKINQKVYILVDIVQSLSIAKVAA